MAENKKSFVLYADIIHTVKKMPDVKAGLLLKTILSYVNDENPTIDDMVVDLVFEPIKQQLKRDLREWEQKRLDRAKAGQAGGKKSGNQRSKPKQNEANEANACFASNNEANDSNTSKNEANEAVNANANVNVKKASSSSFDVFEIMRRQLLPSQFSDNYIKDEAYNFVRKYKDKDIKNISALVSTWVSNMEPDIKPKKFVN